MNPQEALFQSLASCGAVHIGFIGLAHEFIGAQLFPWARALFGTVLWHLAGLSVVALGMLLFAGTLHLIKISVIPIALLAAAVSVATVVLIEIFHGQFNFLALTMAAAGLLTAVFHGKSDRARS